MEHANFGSTQGSEWTTSVKVGIVLTAFGIIGLPNIIQWLLERPGRERDREQMNRIERDNIRILQNQLADQLARDVVRAGEGRSSTDGRALMRDNAAANDAVVTEYRRNSYDDDATRIARLSGSGGASASGTQRTILHPRRGVPARPSLSGSGWTNHPTLARTLQHSPSGWHFHQAEDGHHWWKHPGSDDTKNWHS